MKKLLAFLLAMLMVLSLFAGCGGKDNTAGTGGDKNESGDKKEDKTEPAELGLVGFSTVSMSESIYVLQEAALKKVFEGKANEGPDYRSPTDAQRRYHDQIHLGPPFGKRPAASLSQEMLQALCLTPIR